MSEKKTLVKKLAEVVQATNSINKSGYNAFGKYNYSTEQDIYETLRVELSKRNVFISSSVEEVTLIDGITTVKMKNIFMDGDSGEELVVNSFGQDNNQKDGKALYRALTGAAKYMFLKNFLLISEPMDPESVDELPKETPKASFPKPMMKPVEQLPTAKKDNVLPSVKPKTLDTAKKLTQPPQSKAAPIEAEEKAFDDSFEKTDDEPMY